MREMEVTVIQLSSPSDVLLGEKGKMGAGSWGWGDVIQIGLGSSIFVNFIALKI